MLRNLFYQLPSWSLVDISAILVAIRWTVLEDDSLDFVYDNVGIPGTGDRAMEKLRAGGFYVTITGALALRKKKDVSQAMFINSDTNLYNYGLLDELREIVDAGHLRMPSIQKSFGLKDVEAGFELSKTGQVVGKIAIHTSHAPKLIRN